MRDLKGQLVELEDWKRVAFGVCIAERLFPNYALFSYLTECGDAEVLRRALDRIWDRLANRGKLNAETQLEKVEAQMPDPHDFDAYGVYPALDAAVALASTLNLCLQASAEEAASIGALSEESVASYLELLADDSLSDEELVCFINTHELMQQEQAFQDLVLSRLVRLGSNQAGAIDELREIAHNQGVSNIGISAEE